MTETILVPLEKIQPNPYQPRQSEDPEAVREIAISIFRTGLLQTPVARAAEGGHYELAFGHTRRSAFELLATAGVPDAEIGADPEFGLMPLVVRDLTDREMFEIGIGENLKRRDLNAIEQATAMKRYMDEFQATSRQAGELFGVNDATVRGKIRLLDLPEPALEKLSSGQITEGAARKLLTIAKIDPKLVNEAVENLAAGAEGDDILDISLRTSKATFSMWDKWMKRDEGHETPLAGRGLWPISMPASQFPMKRLPQLTAAEVAKSMELEFTADLRTKIEMIMRWFREENPDPAWLAQEHPDLAELIDRIAHLANPQACSACPLHVIMDGGHYCGLKACHKRKRQAWSEEEMQRLADELDLAIYEPAADGKAFIPLSDNSYGETYKSHEALWKKKDENLRLRVHYQEYQQHRFTKSYLVEAGLVGDAAKKVKDAASKARENEKDRREQQDQLWKREMALRDASTKFLEKYAEALFAPAFSGLTNVPAICALLNTRKPSGKKNADIVGQLQVLMAREALRQQVGWERKKKGPEAVAKHLQGVATEWGVKLPADFAERAKKFMPVSTETDEEEDEE